MHTESVLYIVGRADLLSFLLILLAVLVYAPCISYTCGFFWTMVRLTLSSAIIVASGLCKETGFCFFGLLAGWEILRGLRNERSISSQWSRWIRLVMLLVTGTAACYWRVWYTSGTAIERMDPHSNPVAVEKDSWTRKLSYALIHGVYAKLLVWPTFLCYDYSLDAIPLVTSLTDVRLLLALTSYLTVAELLCLSLLVVQPTLPSWCQLISRKRRLFATESPIVGLAIILLSFLPMSNIFFPVGTVIGERLLYIPSAGLLISTVGLAHLCQPRTQRILFWFLLALGFGSAYLCFLRVPEWQTAETITVADGLKQTRSSRVQFNYANILLKNKSYEEALATYQRAIDIDPTDHDALPLYHAGQILFYQGKHEEAEQYLYRAVTGFFSPLTIKEEEIWHDFGLALWFRGKAGEAVDNLQKSLIINPTFTKALNNLACACVYGAASGKLPLEYYQQGLSALDQAIQIEPNSILYWRNAVSIFTMGYNEQGATAAWQRVIELDPDGAEQTGPPIECSWEFYFR